MEFYKVKDYPQAAFAGAYCKNGVAKEDLIVGIIPGGGANWGRQSYLTHWPAEKYAQVADRLAESLDAKIIILRVA